MKRYYAIDTEALKYSGLSLLEWTILENIQFLEHEKGWCYASKVSLAEHHNITERGFYKCRKNLVGNGWLKANAKNHLKVTKKWLDLISKKHHEQSSDHEQSSVNKVPMNHEQSSDETMNKVPTLPIKRELKVENKVETRVNKKFNFYLKKDTHYSNLSNEYKQKLFHKILLIDGAENYDSFINSLESKAGYKYIDFSRVYRTWYKRLEGADRKGQEIELDGVKRFEVKYDGKAYAICPITLDARLGNFKRPDEIQDEDKKERQNHLAAKLASSSRMAETNKKEQTYEDIIAHQAGAKSC